MTHFFSSCFGGQRLKGVLGAKLVPSEAPGEPLFLVAPVTPGSPFVVTLFFSSFGVRSPSAPRAPRPRTPVTTFRGHPDNPG